MQPQNPIQLANQQQAQQPNQQQDINPIILAQQQSGQREQQIQQEGALGQQDQQNSLDAISAASKAMSVLNPNANSKDATSNDMSKVGGALNTNNYSNQCLRFVDDQTGNKNRQPTAIADYQVNAQNNNIKTSGTPPKGARIYFAPTPDNPDGHVMLSNGDGTGTGATTNQGIKTFSIKDWSTYASQKYIGWAPPNSQ